MLQERWSEEKKETKIRYDLHWIGGVPVDVRQAGTGGLPREGLHHGQQKEKKDEPRHDVELNLEAVCVPLPGEKCVFCRSPATRDGLWLMNCIYFPTFVAFGETRINYYYFIFMRVIHKYFVNNISEFHVDCLLFSYRVGWIYLL